MAKIALMLVLVASTSALQFLKPKHKCGDGRCSYHGNYQGANDPGSGQNSGNTGGFGGFGNLWPSASGGASKPDSSAGSSSGGIGSFFPSFGGGASGGASKPDSSAGNSVPNPGLPSSGGIGSFFPSFGGGAQQGDSSQANSAADVAKRFQDPGNWIPASQVPTWQQEQAKVADQTARAGTPETITKRLQDPGNWIDPKKQENSQAIAAGLVGNNYNALANNLGNAISSWSRSEPADQKTTQNLGLGTGLPNAKQYPDGKPIKVTVPQIPSFPTVSSQSLGGWSPSIGQTLGLPGSSPLDSSNWAAPKIAQSSIPR